MANNEAENNVDIDNYNTNELMELLSLDTLSYSGIVDTTKYLINKLQTKPELVSFFQKAQDKLLQILKDKNKENDLQKKNINVQNEWKYKKYPPSQRNEPLRSGEAMSVIEQDTHFVINKKNLGQQNVKVNDFIQGTLNPNLKNINTLLVCIDSQYRQNILPYAKNNTNIPSFNTDYTLDLSDRSIKKYCFYHVNFN